MDYVVTLFIKYGGSCAAKRCSVDYGWQELVSFICSRWSDFSMENLVLSYKLRGYGVDLELSNEEDIGTMFSVMLDMQLQSVNILASRIDVSLPAPRTQIAQSNLDMVEFGGMEVAEYDPNEFVAAARSGRRLRSDEWRELIVGVGQVFQGGVVQFRNALAKYSVAMRFDYVFVKNDRSRATAKCKFQAENGCQWRIHGFVDAVDKVFRINSFNRTHSCNVLDQNSSKRRINTKVVADLVVDDVRAMPGITPVQVKNMFQKDYGITITYTLAWKAMEKCRSLIYGDQSVSFSLLRPYFNEADRTNPGSCFDLDIDQESMRFRRCFFAFAGSLVGFKQCRPLLMVDGTFLKGKHRGILLSAVGKDGNQGLFPLAFAIVNEETYANWGYFFHHLKIALNDDRRDIVFISDRNHGILNGVSTVFPDSPHAYCYVHLKANLKEKFRGYHKLVRKSILKSFGRCAYACTKQDFKDALGDFLRAGGDKAKDFLEETPKENWAQAFFQGKRYGHMTSNACESWNSQILPIRALQITSVVDVIRLILMKHMCNRRLEASKWTGSLTKGIEKKMVLLREEGRVWDICMAVDSIYEVFSSPRAVVDVKERTCTCKLWQINGLPCVHAAAVIFLNLRGDCSFIDSYFHTDTYKDVYASGIIPFIKPVLEENDEIINPPEYHKHRGRPPVKRVASKGEREPPAQRRCGNCKQLANHNKRGCMNPPA